MFHITREGDLPEVEPRILLIERGEEGWPVLDEEDLEQRLEVIRNSVSLEELRKEPDVAAYRQFYWRLGIDPTKRRPSAEALVRRIIAGKPFPRINPIVDRYNLISAENRVSLGAFSVDYLTDKELVLRMANQDEPFLGIGFPEAKPCTGQELVLAVAEEIIALYPYRDSHNSRIRGDDSSVLFVLCVVPGIEESRIEMAAKALVSEFSG
ncbi:MAG: phenylalanine--tRNA ligase beta subunit-related protein [Candidatus Thalassarchaeaceae archaeon]|nr:phenylalanine--tRNA ligase beta subunit-related protein [Candidatus Thalassarchaeaceae archaeon]